MVRIRTPQKFALGTRVANPLEGRTGQIDRFDADTGLYSLLFHDGHREDIDEASAARFVIKTQETSNSNSSSSSTGDRTVEHSADPDKLLGAAVSKTVRSYDNERATVAGHVFSYVADKDEYRVSFSDDTFQNWSRARTRSNVQATADAASGTRSGTKRTASDSSSSSSAHKKKHKASRGSGSDSDDDDGASANTGGGDLDEVELNQMKYPSRSTAYAVIRKVLCVILAQSTIKKTRTEKQVTVLNNEDLKPKRALENFVEAGGLVCLQKVLVIWMRKPATHAGALLILKVLAALPGVTAEAVLQSGIGKTLRGISTVCQSMGHVDPVLGDLSEWIIRSWKRDVMRKALTVSAKELIKENSTALRAVDTLPLYVPPPPTAEKHMSEQQVMTNHLRRLLSGQVDAPRAQDAAKRDDADDANVVYLPRFNSLGSEDARRPVRQAILLDTLAAKINREHVEGLRKQQQQQAQDASANGRVSAAGSSGVSASARKSIWDEDGTDSVAIGRLVFGRPQIQLFHKDGLVAHLRSTARSRIFARQSVVAADGGLALDDEVPAAELPRANKTLAPTKSILKADTTEIVPIAQVRW